MEMKKQNLLINLFDFSQLMEGRTANAVDGIGPNNHAVFTRVRANGVGKLAGAVATFDKVCMGTIASRQSNTSNSSEKWRKQEREKMATTCQLITIVNAISPKA